MIDQTLSARIVAAQDDPKAAHVMMAGYESFCSYGLARTSMQQIASRAGISRAAVYLHFKNKHEIFSSFMDAYYTAAAEAASEALNAQDDPARALANAFNAQVGDVGEALMTSPHAVELWSLSDAATGPSHSAGTDRLVKTYAAWLDAGVMAGRLSSQAVAGSSARAARVMLAGFDGMRTLLPDWTAYRESRAHLARIYARAFSAV